METTDIKNIWNKGVQETFKPYSDKELNKMIVKSARKSINKVYPGTVFRFAVIAVLVYLFATLCLRKQSVEGMIIDIAALIVLSVSYFLWELSAYKMRKYTIGRPVKEWLEYRIKEMEKNIKFNTKYDKVMYICSFLIAIAFYGMRQIAANVIPDILTAIIVLIVIAIYILVVRRSLNQNYQKALNELKELYRQFEEINE
ncbi:hypothetical protein IX307_002424 [Bacteroides pyogenes]|uniref:hypothetical protein n=1 Tax=Bacteroides pyogenes TaxID=310300 RepID=UPI001BAA4DE3|nr:hypothetical protein [Bacteroides pyogenes]MBR8705360.1 hypothetical protein [Bacteroides pyogenes]MBR8721218.1 hypothetical protein [Bacteroides pyogenes]MBR8723863.1 hypothetical protein [Bacteroides pyogenes]MBR8737118.1 hypothetical protein [Bacteroides pyogenes]MBR8752987.1 hypothetical protein [Bacteroides pyogenes]